MVIKFREQPDMMRSLNMSYFGESAALAQQKMEKEKLNYYNEAPNPN